MKKEIKNKYLLLILILLGLALLVALIPVYRLALYTTPYYDDFNYANSVKIIWEGSHSVWKILKEAAWVSKITYYSWQGTYFSVFLMSLMPSVFGIKCYWLGIFFIITVLVVGIFYGNYVIYRKIFGGEKITSLIISEIVLLAVIEFFHSAQQGIYWYNGAVHYTFAHAFMFIFLAMVVNYSCNLVNCEKNGRTRLIGTIAKAIGLALMSFLVAGTNFITGLQGILLFAVIIFFSLIQKRKKQLYILIPFVAYCVGLIINIAAPGNESRQALYEGYARGPINSIGMSFVSAFQYLGAFTGIRTFAIVIALLPFFYLVAKNTKFRFRFPVLVTVLSFCFYATGFTPSWYGIGEAGLARSLCAVKITFQILLFVNEMYWVGWITQKQFEYNKWALCEKIIKNYIVAFAAAIVITVVSFVTEDNQAGSFMSYGAYYYVHTGEAANYYNEQLEREKTITEGGANIELAPLVWRPWFLCKKEELDTNPNAEQNQAAARWYNKSSIYVSEE